MDTYVTLWSESAAFPLLTTLTVVLTLLALVYTLITRHVTDRLFIACLLGYEGILIGAFAALNVMQFWMWSVLELIPVVLLTTHAGTGQNRRWVIALLFDVNHGNKLQLVEQYAWIPSLNIEFLVGIDGISVLFLPMSALLTLMAIMASWNSVQHLHRFHFALLLALEGITIGVFSALDTVLFFLFWELTLPPIFFVIGLWGIGPKRRSDAMKYTLFMLFGSVPLLFAIIILAINHAVDVNGAIPQNLCFSLPVLLETQLPDNLQALVFLLLLSGFAVKAPLIPFHTWLPTAAMEGPTQITALLTGLKLGVYGILRFTMPLASSAAVEYSWILGILGAVTLIYAALIALQQSNLLPAGRFSDRLIKPRLIRHTICARVNWHCCVYPRYWF